jgi:hypothetical protein
MTKLMDELVEIGAKAFGGRGLAYRNEDDARLVLNAVLPVLAQRMMKPTPHMVREGSGVQNTAITVVTGGEGPPLLFQATETDIWQAMMLEFFKRELDMVGELTAVSPAPSPPEC